MIWDENDCPRSELHTPAPRGYAQWHEWAEKMQKTHKQKRCPGCRRWAIWVPREKRAKRAEEAGANEPSSQEQTQLPADARE